MVAGSGWLRPHPAQQWTEPPDQIGDEHGVTAGSHFGQRPVLGLVRGVRQRDDLGGGARIEPRWVDNQVRLGTVRTQQVEEGEGYFRISDG